MSALYTSVERSTSIGLLRERFLFERQFNGLKMDQQETNNKITIDINPELRNAADDWKMWLSNFEVFVDAIDLVLFLVTSWSYSNLIFRARSTSYKKVASFANAVKILNDKFIKPISKAHHQHCLATHIQQAGESTV